MPVRPSVEVRTRSVPTAAALILVGFEPLRVLHRDHGGSLLVFPAAARRALDSFLAAKQRVDALLEDEDARR